MHRRSLVIIGLLFILALPLTASQFIDLPFEQVASESRYIVRGTMGQTWSAWDDAHEVIYTYATVRVHRYFGEATGPDTLMIREVGGTVDGYTQEAIGFPAIRSGENVVLLLTQWDGSADYRIHAFNKGKFLVRSRAGIETLVNDPATQGEERLSARERGGIRAQAADDEATGLGIEEFSRMVEDARAGRTATGQKHQNQ